MEEIIFKNKQELRNFLDVVLNCKEEGINAKWIDTNKNSIEQYVNDYFN